MAGRYIDEEKFKKGGNGMLDRTNAERKACGREVFASFDVVKSWKRWEEGRESGEMEREGCKIGP